MANHESGLESLTPSRVPSALIRLLAKIFNPLVLAIAGRRWMPIVGVLHHHGWRTDRVYATPVGMRRAGDVFLIPLTLGDQSRWYRNVRAAGGAVVAYGGRRTKVGSPNVVGWDEASSAFPRYERALFRGVGIRYFLRLSVDLTRPQPGGPSRAGSAPPDWR